MKKSSKDFPVFQKEFTYWQQKLGCTGYKVYFKHKPLDECFAQVSFGDENMVMTACLNSKLPEKDRPHKDVKQSAKHEAIHVMLHRLEQLAVSRYVRNGEIYEATEELVFKLERLL